MLQAQVGTRPGVGGSPPPGLVGLPAGERDLAAGVAGSRRARDEAGVGERQRQAAAAVVVDVLADQVDPAGGGVDRDGRRGGGRAGRFGRAPGLEVGREPRGDLLGVAGGEVLQRGGHPPDSKSWCDVSEE